MFTDDLLIIDKLRTAAINVQEPHTSGISKLFAYAAQLKWIGGKFPIDVCATHFQEKNDIGGISCCGMDC